MNHIIKPFRPYFNTPLDPRRTQGMIAYYDATTQQGGGYLADKVGNRHGVFYGSPTWQNGNSIKGSDSSAKYIEISGLGNQSWKFPFSILSLMAIDTLTTGRIFLSFPATSSNYAYTWSIGSTVINIGRQGALFAFNKNLITAKKIFHIAVIYNSATSQTVYIDGVDSTISGNDYFGMANTTIQIGNRSSGFNYCDYRLQQIAFFNRALTRSEILNHYQDQYYFYERPKIYGFISSSSGSSLPVIINNYRQQGVM